MPSTGPVTATSSPDLQGATLSLTRQRLLIFASADNIANMSTPPRAGRAVNAVAFSQDGSVLACGTTAGGPGETCMGRSKHSPGPL